VNPLMIAGGIRELIDARLRDLEPVADGNLLADAIAECMDVDVDHVSLLIAYRASLSRSPARFGDPKRFALSDRM
jgi:hypothetical protein